MKRNNVKLLCVVLLVLSLMLNVVLSTSATGSSQSGGNTGSGNSYSSSNYVTSSNNSGGKSSSGSAGASSSTGSNNSGSNNSGSNNSGSSNSGGAAGSSSASQSSSPTTSATGGSTSSNYVTSSNSNGGAGSTSSKFTSTGSATSGGASSGLSSTGLNTGSGTATGYSSEDWSDSSFDFSSDSGCYQLQDGSFDCGSSMDSWESQSSVEPITVQSSESDLQRTASFLIGVAEGIIDQVIEDTVITCLKDVNKTLVEFETGLGDIKAALEDNSVDAAAKGVYNLYNGVKSIKSTYSACKLQQITNDIAGIVADFDSGFGALVFIAKETMNIYHNKVEVTGDFQNMVKYWESGSYELSGFYVGRLLVIMIQASLVHQ